jgi:arylsulfatase A-like enzyme
MSRRDQRIIAQGKRSAALGYYPAAPPGRQSFHSCGFVGQALTALLLLASLAALDAAEAPGAAAKPNIVVILTDDQGRGDYSAFGTRDIRTPHIDRLFREGLTFRNFFANSCVCSPSRASLLTGCYPDRVGVPGVIREETPDDSWGYFSPAAKLLPQLLKPAGYHTALVGKWHLGIGSPNTPTERGFDFFHGFLGDMMDDYWTHRRHGHNFMRRDQEVIDPQGHATDIFTGWACDYLAERAKTGGPFLLYLAYNAPHDPVQPPPEWLEKVKRREPGLPENRARLVALIEHLDAGIGKVLGELDRTGLAANTLVIFTSDNGGVLANGANNGPWRSGKGHIYEGGLRVPGAARWPGVIKPGAATGRLTLTMDIFATACVVAGVQPPPDIDGLSFLPTLRGEADAQDRRDCYFVRREGGPAYGGKTIEAFRRGDWKLLQDSPFAPLELYDLNSDPQEATDLAAKNRTVFNELAAALSRQIQRAGATPWQKPVHEAGENLP